MQMHPYLHSTDDDFTSIMLVPVYLLLLMGNGPYLGFLKCQ